MPAAILKLLSSASTQVPDAELLARFVASRDESSFAELVRRHGPVVYRVCRRLVRADVADDAFQATFLVLACRAERLRKPGSVGSWLIGVAGRVARQMRTREARPASRASHGTGESHNNNPCVDTHGSPEIAELAAVLDDELTRLPDALRSAVVLCLVEGRTQDEAAATLGGSVRTLRRRLDRAKSLLRLRLERRGIVPAIAAGLVSGGMARAAAVPEVLVKKTAGGVSEFLAGRGAMTPAAVVAKGVVGSMVTMKHWLTAAGVGLVGLGLAFGVAAQQDSRPSTPLPNLPMTGQSGAMPPAADFRLAKPDPDTAGEFVQKTKNFVVAYAHSPVIARAVAAEAEFQREVIAKRWFGEALPDWEQPAVIRVTNAAVSSGSQYQFEYGPKGISEIKLYLNGPLLTVLESSLPRDIAHAVFATRFRELRPRWATEGVAWLHESEAKQVEQDVRVRELLNAGRAIRLQKLFQMAEYPREMTVFSAQGHSVVRFLLTRKAVANGTWSRQVVGYDEQRSGDGQPIRIVARFDPTKPHEAVVAFAEIGSSKNTSESWNKAAKEVYGFESVDDLESAWLDWLKSRESRLGGEKPQNKPDHIPPQNIPGGGR